MLLMDTVQSANGEYVVKLDEENNSVVLMKNDIEIWNKFFVDIEMAYPLNNGNVCILLHSESRKSKLVIYNKEGNEVYSYIFDSILKTPAISYSENYLALSIADYPYCSICLFDLENKKLLWEKVAEVRKFTGLMFSSSDEILVVYGGEDLIEVLEEHEFSENPFIPHLEIPDEFILYKIDLYGNKL